jgi:hydrogenase expression/formation protein HypC
MCLAVPGRVIECVDEEALIDLQGSRIRVSTLLTPHVAVGDWVLAHAGFAIALIDEEQALETWGWLRTISEDSPAELEGTGPVEPQERAPRGPGGG